MGRWGGARRDPAQRGARHEPARRDRVACLACAAARTFPNPIKIGLRAVDILQSEVSANNLADAALINDLIAARAAQLRALQSEGIGGAQAAWTPDQVRRDEI